MFQTIVVSTMESTCITAEEGGCLYQVLIEDGLHNNG